MVSPRKSIALIGQGLTGGGAESVMLRLADSFAARGFDVRVAVLHKRGELLGDLPANMRIDEIGGGRVSCIPRLARYLRRNRSDAIISFMTYTNVVAILAQLISPSIRKIIVTEHNAYSRSIGNRAAVIRFFYHLVPAAYRWTSSVICVSRGVEADLSSAAHLPPRLLTTVYNPVITDDLIARSFEEPDHPWLKEKTCPVVLAVGRLEKQKNYPMLFEAFSRLRTKMRCRLIVLGEGRLRARLAAKIDDLGISDDVDLAGFKRNPYAFMRRADVLTLTSDWEGLSNVLIEAMAVGCPVVTTDAPHGPREVVQEGRLGRLVPVGDAKAFAEALEGVLKAPGDPEPGKLWANTFNVEVCTDRYLAVARLL